jgi:Uma2 family endonuclease
MTVRRMTYNAYLAEEDRYSSINEQHEFVEGQTFPITRSLEHEACISEIYTRLSRALVSESFRVNQRSCRFFFPSKQRTIHPDVVVTRGPTEAPREDPGAIANPLTIFDVVDEAALPAARGYKWDLYKRFETLREYAIVYEHAPLVEVFSRETTDTNVWRHETYRARSRIELASLELSIDVAPRLAVYAWFRG